MTKQELNRDIKRLSANYNKLMAKGSANVPDFWPQIEGLKNEFIRLHHASDDFTCLTQANVLRLIRLNQSMRAVAFHHFANKITIV